MKYHLLTSSEIKKLRHFRDGEVGAGNGTRTCDLLITNQLLYRLSYTSKQNSGMSPPFMTADNNTIFSFERQYKFHPFRPKPNNTDCITASFLAKTISAFLYKNNACLQI